MAGYTVVTPTPEGDSFETLVSTPLDAPLSAQAAELKALTAACHLGRGKSCTIYTDSTYAQLILSLCVCHLNGSIWHQHGFVREDGKSVAHGSLIADLLQ